MQTTFRTIRRQTTDTCKFCGEPVSLHDSGVTYKNGESAHEDCHDAEEFRRENAADLADREGY